MISDYLENTVLDTNYSLRIVVTDRTEYSPTEFNNKTYIYKSNWCNEHLLYQLAFRLEVLVTKEVLNKLKDYKDFYIDIVITHPKFSIRKLITKTACYYSISKINNHTTSNFLYKTKLVEIINTEIISTVENIKQVELFIKDNLY